MLAVAQTKSVQVVDQKKGHALGRPENTRMWCGGVTSTKASTGKAESGP